MVHPVINTGASSSPDPDPNLLGSTYPSPNYGKPFQASSPESKPLPPLWKIWANIVILGWVFGVGLILGIAWSITGIVRSRQQGKSPAKYVAPLATIIAVIAALITVGLTVGKPSSNSSVKPIYAPSSVYPAGSVPSAEVKTPSPMATGTVDQRIAVVKALLGPDGAYLAASPTDNTEKAFSKAWSIANRAIATHDPRYLWGIFATTDDPKGYGYKIKAELMAHEYKGYFGSHRVNSSDQATGKSTRVIDITFTDAGGVSHEAYFALFWRDGLWIIDQSAAVSDY
jgi:hypothetical protein